MARPARRNAMTFAQIYRAYVPGSKWKRRKARSGPWSGWSAPPDARTTAKRRAIEEQS